MSSHRLQDRHDVKHASRVQTRMPTLRRIPNRIHSPNRPKTSRMTLVPTASRGISSTLKHDLITKSSCTHMLIIFNNTYNMYPDKLIVLNSKPFFQSNVSFKTQNATYIFLLIGQVGSALMKFARSTRSCTLGTTEWTSLLKCLNGLRRSWNVFFSYYIVFFLYSYMDIEKGYAWTRADASRKDAQSYR